MKKTLIIILSVLTISMPMCASASLSTGLVGYWPLDTRDGFVLGTEYDRSGNGNTGTFYGIYTNVIGKIRQAVNFNGSSAYIDAGNNSSLQITGNISVSAWVNSSVLPSGANQYQGIVVKGYDGTNTGFQLDYQDDASTGDQC